MLNIVIPMAGRGSRFAKVGYTLPKPLIPIHKKSLIECVTENIKPDCEHRYIYICLQEHLEQYNLTEKLEKIAPGCKIITVDKVTEGAACTVLLAQEYIDNNDGLMIANSDQYVDVNINTYLASLKNKDGLIMTMQANNSKWSYIKYNKENNVTMVREKEVISDMATVGIYNYQHGCDFVKYAKRMIEKNIRVNNEFYVAPVYNEMIEEGKKIGYFSIGSVEDGMFGLGTPKDLEIFKKLDISKRF